MKCHFAARKKKTKKKIINGVPVEIDHAKREQETKFNLIYGN